MQFRAKFAAMPPGGRKGCRQEPWAEAKSELNQMIAAFAQSIGCASAAMSHNGNITAESAAADNCATMRIR